MKPLLFLAIVIALTSCSGFEHMHYRKLNKVPATGRVEEKMIISPGKPHAATRQAENDSIITPVNAGKEISGAPGLLENNKHAYKSHSSGGIRRMIRSGKAVVKKAGEQKNKKLIHRRGDGSVFLIFLFLFLGLALLLTGISMVVIGINAIIWWLILSGGAIVFIGLIPFLGMISFMFGGDRYHPSPAYEESQKSSFFPDHQ